MSVFNIVNASATFTAARASFAGFGVSVALHTFTAPQRVAIGASWFEIDNSNWDTTLAGFGVGSGETVYKAAQTFFGQAGAKPEKLIWISAADKVAQISSIQVVTFVDGPYIVTIGGTAFNHPAVSEASATSLAAALIVLIDADPLYGAVAGGAGELIVTRAQAGIPMVIGVSSPNADMTTAITAASEGYIEDLAAFTLVNPDYWFVLETARNTAENIAAAAVIQTQERLAVFLEAAASAQDVGDSTDLASLGAALSLQRLAPHYDPEATDFPDFAAVGLNAPKTPGSLTWHMQAVALTTAFVPTSRSTLEAKHYNWNELFSSVTGSPSAMQNGQVADGRFIDEIRGRDAFARDLRETMFFAFLSAEKVEFEEEGLDILEAKLREVVARWDENRFLNADSLVVTRVAVADIAADIRSARCYGGLAYEVKMRGAIHKLDPLTGTLTT